MADATATPSTPGQLTLAPLERRHLERTLAWANDPALMRLLNRAQTVSPAEHERWFDELRQATDRRYYAIETGAQRHVGNVWLWQIDPRHRKAEVRIVIGETDSQGRGLGTRAIELVAATAFGTLELHRLYAFVLEINPRARRAFEKAGFRLEGVLEQDRWTGNGYCDVFVLGKNRQQTGPG